MKKLSFLLVILAFISACGDNPATVNFKLDYTSSITVPSSTGITLPLDLMTPEVETNSESEFAVNDTRKDLIEEILLEKCTMTIDYPSDQDFDFLNSIEIYLSAEGLDEILIGSKTNIPENGAKTITIEPTGEDFKEYIKKDNFNLRVYTKTDKANSREIGIEVYTEYAVKARLIN